MATLYAITCDWPASNYFPPKREFCNLATEESQCFMTTSDKGWALDRLQWFEKNHRAFTYTLVTIRGLKD